MLKIVGCVEAGVKTLGGRTVPNTKQRKKYYIYNKNKTMARTKASKMFGGKHLQHTSKFIKELNSVQMNSNINAIRYLDETWLIGKYKGSKVATTPKSYIKWAVDNIKISSTCLSILKKYI